jgi:crotonobetainyl-CoA:carnitine CoA-transferase CaiB-like acyl-CoA transferase
VPADSYPGSPLRDACGRSSGSARRPDGKPPFEGLRVLEVGQIYAGPYCGLLFAQLGAEVIKLEPPAGERLRYRSTADVETHEFLMLNSSKRSICVDLRRDDGRAIFLDLIDHVDVVIENFAPGVMERMRIGPDALLARNPRLVVASCKGYGSEGPYRDMAAMDITVQAMAGAIASTGFPDGPPVKAGPAFVDFSAGTHLFAAAVAALYQRTFTGRGQRVEVSMHDTVYPMLASALGGIHNESATEVPERTGNRHSGHAIAPYNVYRSADGWVAVIAIAEKHFEGIARAIGRADLTSDERFAGRLERLEHVDELDAVVEEWTSVRSRWDAVAILQAAGVPCAPVLTVAEVDADPHLRHRGMIQDVDHPELGVVPVAGCPLELGRGPRPRMRLAEPLGASTTTVLADVCGYSDARVRELLDLDVACSVTQGERSQ